MKTVQFSVTKGEARVIGNIASRAVALARTIGVEYELQDAIMDLTACHANGCRLDLQRLEVADDANFGHDVFGIRRYLNRDNGQLQEFFIPRFARH